MVNILKLYVVQCMIKIKKKGSKVVPIKPTNKKVKNATKKVFNDLTFDSQLEVFFYKLCLKENIIVEREPKFVLQSKFEFMGEKLREIAMFPDFYLPEFDILLECKGFANDLFPLKRKLLLFHLKTHFPNRRYFMVKNQKECIEFINNLENERS